MWKTVKLGGVAKFTRGLTYSKKDEVESGGTAVLRATNVDLKSHKLTFDEIRYIDKSVTVREDKLAKKGDILICTASGSKSHLGKVALVEADLGMAFGGFMAVLRCEHNCLPEFLYLALTSHNFFSHLSSLSDGASINNLKYSQIANFELPLPPLAEQQRIVAKLDAAFVEIDKAVASKFRSCDELAFLESSLTSAVVQKFISSCELVRIADLFSIRSGDFLPKRKMKEDGSFNVYGGNGRSGTHDERNLSGKQLIIGRVGQKCGNTRVLDEEFWLTDNAFYVNEYHQEIDIDYLSLILTNCNLRQYARNGDLPVLSFRGIKDIEIPFHKDIKVQLDIVNRSKNIDDSLKVAVSLKEQHLSLFGELKSSVLRSVLQSKAA
jgi:type I restriction enzyme, S subunit